MPRWFPFGGSESTDNDRPLESTRFVVIDTELTSLDQRTNRLLSVGAVGMTGSKIMVGEQFYRVVNPGVVIPAEGIVIHGLLPEEIKGGYDLPTTIAELNRFIQGAVLVGHFAEIDRSVLLKEFAASRISLNNPMVCTARVQRWIVKKQPFTEEQFRDMEITDLESLAKIYKLDFHEAHHALDDAFVTARLWQKQIHVLNGLEVKTLRNLLRFAKV